jgi:predicted dehydrogenase
MDRRDFIKDGAIGTVAAGVLTGSSGRILGANDRIQLGVIGAGRQAMATTDAFLKESNVELVAVNDVYEPNMLKLAAKSERAQKYKDFRQVLDNKDVDVVIISTPDHWHAIQTIMACQAGKDIFVEKPISLTVEEGRRMVQAARKHKRVVQVGTWQRSGEHFKKVVDIVRSGKLGKISLVRTWTMRNSFPEGIGNPPNTNPPAGLDWDMWLGPAPKVPFNQNRFGVTEKGYSTFRWFWDYAGGMMTDWGVHLLDIVHWAVTASGGKFALKDNRETPDTMTVTYEYPGFICTYEHRECSSALTHFNAGHGIIFHGTNASLFVSRTGYELVPETKGDKPVIPAEKGERINHGLGSHVKNLIECMKTRQNPMSDIEIGHTSSTACYLGNIAYRTRTRIQWDGKSEKILNDKKANSLLSKDYRKPWDLKV